MYDKYHVPLEELLNRDQDISVCYKHSSALLTEIAKTISGENPHVKKIFTQ